MGLPSAPSIAPSHSPVPVGFTPDSNPNSGASRVIVAASGVSSTGVLFTGGVSTRVLLAGGVSTGVLFAGGFGGVATSVPSLIAFCKAPSLVEANGQPFPGPFRFWMVMEAALILADLSCFESPVGNEILTEGLLTASPAWTFLIKAWSACVRTNGREIRNTSRAQGCKPPGSADKRTGS